MRHFTPQDHFRLVTGLKEETGHSMCSSICLIGVFSIPSQFSSSSQQSVPGQQLLQPQLASPTQSNKTTSYHSAHHWLWGPHLFFLGDLVLLLGQRHLGSLDSLEESRVDRHHPVPLFSPLRNEDSLCGDY